ncbi:GH92 family glycosyl hydrolase [Gluconacetobacter tumulicola]|uniref:Glycoside hydrolase family 92 protein n=1 Tax=Gluconacetobacter tumulicola TaxID=1017177 RepID=A0A7W4JFR9_9PROT|nr:GH92 family glycosyl hydrolase [Gluconacetobacter tumulicola]MBB2180443.1 glycoside hydrolase family 92 protein [Gluconacetobacter tumulicola]
MTRRPPLYCLSATLALAIALPPGPAHASMDTTGGPAAMVDPRIGTGGPGHTFPGATVPFGMIQPSPDTAMPEFHHAYDWAGGYQYNDPTIMGFSHTHFSGAGHSDLGDVLLMPISGDVRMEPGDPTKPQSGYRSRFSHATEVEHPGYYAVTLDDYAVRAELTAGLRVGWHRYTFPADKPAHVLLDLRPSIYDYPGKVLWTRLRVREDGTVTGCRTTRGWAPGRTLCFAMRFSRPMTARTLYNRETNVLYRGFRGPGNAPVDQNVQNGRAVQAVFDFGMLDGPLGVKVAISPVSETNAIANLDKEGPGWDFDARRAEATAMWNRALSVIDAAGTPDQRTQFYTALYHAMLAPTLSMDTNGEYRGPDQEIHKAQGFGFYSTWSTWDVYRAQQPLMALLRPDMSTQFVRSLIAAQQASPVGVLPVWSYQGLETWCMTGYHAVPIIADAYLAGVRGFDADAALNAMVASATSPVYGDLTDYIRLGYVPIDKEAEAGSKTLEYAYDDWSLARMARAMGRTRIAEQFEKRAGNWRNEWDPQTGFMRARLSTGQFHTPFDPTAAAYGSDYTEGNAWQYLWFVPQDVPGLIEAMGGDAPFIARLDTLFDTRVDPAQFKNVEDISGLIGWYAHGNEPSHHIAYLYDYAGAPWKTQQRLKQIMDSQYSGRPDGLAGNDDLGQTSAWYLFTALGFYPVAPGSNDYTIGRPFVPRAAIHLPNGRTFTMVADHLDAAHPYVAAVTLNGKPQDLLHLRQQDILNGGELRFVMQAEPKRP